MAMKMFTFTTYSDGTLILKGLRHVFRLTLVLLRILTVP